MIPIPVATHVSKKIRPEFPTTPEGKLMFAVVDRALRDAYGCEGRMTGKVYLAGPMPHAEICGVSAAWIRRVIERSERMFAELAV